MNERQIATILRAELLKGLARYGITDLPVKPLYQPTVQGRVERGLYFQAISENRIGEQFRNHIPGAGGVMMTTKETQILATTYQFNALAELNVADATQRTAKDLTNLARMVVASQPFIQAMTKAGIGVRQITDIRNPKLVNDKDHFEDNPSFDCTFTHKQVIIQSTDSTERVELNIRRV